MSGLNRRGVAMLSAGFAGGVAVLGVAGNRLMVLAALAVYAVGIVDGVVSVHRHSARRRRAASPPVLTYRGGVR